jgi:hypothetical protein
MKILNRAKLVLACAALAVPLSAAAVAMPATALAQPVVSAHHTAMPRTTGCADEQVRSATLGTHYGTVLLCYNPSNRTVWAKVNTANLSACNPPSDVGCGTATVLNVTGGHASKSCTIPRGKTGCATLAINDKNVTSIAKATVIIEGPCANLRNCETASGQTKPPF